MNKEEYISRLRNHLNYYLGDHTEIINNYEIIIDELIDEGHTMQDVVTQLGRPEVLAEEIAAEFNLVYTPQTLKSTSLPSWARTLLIIVALIFVGPLIFSLVFGILGTLITIIVSSIVLMFGGGINGFNIWSLSGLSTNYKLLATITGAFGILSSLILTYFVIFWAIRGVKYLVSLFQKINKGGF